MPLTVERADARDWSADQLEVLFAGGFPRFITADRTTGRYIERVRQWFGAFELMLVDDAGALGTPGTPVAAGWGVPVRWDGDPLSLPSGYADSLVRAVEGRQNGTAPDTFVVCAAVVAPSLTGRGLAGELLTALCRAAADAGWDRVVAPVRPTDKSRYPLTPIDTFAAWTRPDGSAFDPWLRTHLRLGGRILATAPASQTMTGTVAEWSEWTGMEFPDSGDYVIPDGLSPLRVDRAADLGTYVEPNVWVQHRPERPRVTEVPLVRRSSEATRPR